MKFDYIIIGAGSAGCVLSNRLSENQNNKDAVFDAAGSLIKAINGIEKGEFKDVCN